MCEGGCKAGRRIVLGRAALAAQGVKPKAVVEVSTAKMYTRVDMESPHVDPSVVSSKYTFQTPEAKARNRAADAATGLLPSEVASFNQRAAAAVARFGGAVLQAAGFRPREGTNTDNKALGRRELTSGLLSTPLWSPSFGKLKK